MLSFWCWQGPWSAFSTPHSAVTRRRGTALSTFVQASTTVEQEHEVNKQAHTDWIACCMALLQVNTLLVLVSLMIRGIWQNAVTSAYQHKHFSEFFPPEQFWLGSCQRLSAGQIMILSFGSSLSLGFTFGNWRPFLNLTLLQLLFIILTFSILNDTYYMTAQVAEWLSCPLLVQEVVGSTPCHVKPKTLKSVN